MNLGTEMLRLRELKTVRIWLPITACACEALCFPGCGDRGSTAPFIGHVTSAVEGWGKTLKLPDRCRSLVPGVRGERASRRRGGVLNACRLLLNILVRSNLKPLRHYLSFVGLCSVAENRNELITGRAWAFPLNTIVLDPKLVYLKLICLCYFGC